MGKRLINWKAFVFPKWIRGLLAENSCGRKALLNAKLGIDSYERIFVVDDRLRLKELRLRKELRYFSFLLLSGGGRVDLWFPGGIRPFLQRPASNLEHLRWIRSLGAVSHRHSVNQRAQLVTGLERCLPIPDPSESDSQAVDVCCRTCK